MDFEDTYLPNMATLILETKSCFGTSGIENFTVSHHGWQQGRPAYEQYQRVATLIGFIINCLLQPVQ